MPEHFPVTFAKFLRTPFLQSTSGRLLLKNVLNIVILCRISVQVTATRLERTTFSHLASLAKWLTVYLKIKWLWIRIPLRSLKYQISRLLRAKSSLTFTLTAYET